MFLIELEDMSKWIDILLELVDLESKEPLFISSIGNVDFFRTFADRKLRTVRVNN